MTSMQRRGYRSGLRAQQVEATRTLILDATLRVMAQGIATLSIPAVAREAGVSLGTIYYHFATKADLLAEVYPHLMRRAGVDKVPLPRTVDEVREAVRAIFDRMDSLDDLARAAAVSPAGEEARHVSMRQRLELGRRIARDHAPTLSRTDEDRIARLMAVLISSASLRTWRRHLGSSVDEAAADIDWVLRAALAAATSEEHSR